MQTKRDLAHGDTPANSRDRPHFCMKVVFQDHLDHDQGLRNTEITQTVRKHVVCAWSGIKICRKHLDAVVTCSTIASGYASKMQCYTSLPLHTLQLLKRVLNLSGSAILGYAQSRYCVARRTCIIVRSECLTVSSDAL